MNEKLTGTVALPVTIKTDSFLGKAFLVDNNNEWLADVHSKKADAVARILNSHAALVVALEFCVLRMGSEDHRFPIKEKVKRNRFIEQAHAALRLAKSGEGE